MNKLCIVGFAFALTFAATASAQQFKWVDKDGRVRYSDVPPPGVKATPLRPPPGPVSVPSPSKPAAAGKKDEKPLTPEEAFQKRQKDQQEAAAKAEKERADSEAKKTNCDGARQNLSQLESGQRMSTMSPTGERGYMDDSQRAKEIDRARKAVADWCK